MSWLCYAISHLLNIHRNDLVEMFEDSIKTAFTIIDKISEKLKEEKLGPFHMMCLCGGLGSSEYVWTRFTQYKKEKFGDKCKLHLSPRAWSAVVRGAAIRGLYGSLVLSRRAKRAYGIGIHQPFREGIDKEEDAWICPIKKDKRAGGYVFWPVKM